MILLLVAVAGSNIGAAKAPSMLDDECSLSSSEITAIQTALADYEEWELSYVVAQTIAVTATTCDGAVPMGGTITLDIGNVPVTWNWERQGGTNVIVVWPT